MLLQWWENQIKGQLKCIVEHPRHNLLQEWTGLFQSRIRIYLYQPRLHTFINHEIIPQDFKAETPVCFVYFLSCRDEGHFNYRYDFATRILIKVDSSLCLSLLERENVPNLVYAVVFVLLLNCDVRQMHCEVFKFFDLKSVRFARHSNVALLKQKTAMVVCYEHPHPNVKFSLVDQHRLLYVLLDYEYIRFDYCCCWLLAGGVQFAIRFITPRAYLLSTVTSCLHHCRLVNLLGGFRLLLFFARACFNLNTHCVIINEFLQLFY